MLAEFNDSVEIIYVLIVERYPKLGAIYKKMTTPLASIKIEPVIHVTVKLSIFYIFLQKAIHILCGPKSLWKNMSNGKKLL